MWCIVSGVGQKLHMPVHLIFLLLYIRPAHFGGNTCLLRSMCLALLEVLSRQYQIINLIMKKVALMPQVAVFTLIEGIIVLFYFLPVSLMSQSLIY